MAKPLTLPNLSVDTSPPMCTPMSAPLSHEEFA